MASIPFGGALRQAQGDTQGIAAAEGGRIQTGMNRGAPEHGWLLESGQRICRGVAVWIGVKPPLIGNLTSCLRRGRLLTAYLQPDPLADVGRNAVGDFGVGFHQSRDIGQVFLALAGAATRIGIG